jgi:hypothetical protein
MIQEFELEQSGSERKNGQETSSRKCGKTQSLLTGFTFRREILTEG